jgi:hypothetical protein
MDLEKFHCPESVTGHGLADKQGKCPFCRRKVDSKQPRPLAPKAFPRTELDQAYGYMWDPDFGNSKDDFY